MASTGSCVLVLDTRCFDSSASEMHAVAIAGAAESISQFLRLRLCSAEVPTQRIIATLSEASSALRDVRQYLLRSLDRGTDRSAELIASAMAQLTSLRADATGDQGRLVLIITAPEALPWRTERLRKALRALSNGMVPVDVLLFSPPVVSLFAAPEADSAWERLSELAELGRTWMNCKITKVATGTSKSPCRAVLTVVAGEALSEALKRLAVEAPRFPVTLQLGDLEIQGSAYEETSPSLHSRLEFACLCHGALVKSSLAHTCAENGARLTKVAPVESLGKLILGRAKPQTQMPALRAEELLHMRSLNSSVMRGESVVVVPCQDFDNIAEYTRNKALFDALLESLKERACAVHLSARGTFSPPRGSALVHHFALVPPQKEATGSAFLLKELIPEEAYLGSEQLPATEELQPDTRAAVEAQLKELTCADLNPLAIHSGLHELALSHAPAQRKAASSPPKSATKVAPSPMHTPKRHASPPLPPQRSTNAAVGGSSGGSAGVAAGEKRRLLAFRRPDRAPEEEVEW